MAAEDMPEFQPGQRVRVREDGGDSSSRPDRRYIGKWGTIQHRTGNLDGPPTFYFVEFDAGGVFAISPNWLERLENRE